MAGGAETSYIAALPAIALHRRARGFARGDAGQRELPEWLKAGNRSGEN